MKKILFFSGSRADFGLLYPVIKEIQRQKKIKSYLLLGGHHFNKSYGNSYNYVKNFKLKNTIKSKIILKKTSSSQIVDFISKFLFETKNLLLKIKPNLVVILGDRYEITSVAIASFFLNIPIVHLHGGEVTQGANDDTTRHVVSKYSSYHFVSHKDYKKRLIQLGEQPKTIFNYGSIGAQISKEIKLINFKLLEKKYDILKKKYFIITLHPETNFKKKSKIYLNNLLSVLKKQKNYKLIFTCNNNDELGDYFLNKINNFCNKNINAKLIHNLGTIEYFSLAKEAKAVIGNSSSGIIEIPSLKVPTLNIGGRQKGRIMGPSVINSDGSKKNLKNMINLLKVNKKIFYKNIYYKKNSIKKIKNKIIQFITSQTKNKTFYDL